MELHEIPARKHNKKPAKRIGRGYGSGKGGHTVGKGMKGQKSRAGGPKPVGFEGGNVPLYRRLPKFRGFKNPTRVEYQPVNIADIESHYSDGGVVSLLSLKETGIVKKRSNRVKILAKGDISKKITVVGLPVTESARKKIEKAGGEVK